MHHRNRASHPQSIHCTKHQQLHSIPSTYNIHSIATNHFFQGLIWSTDFWLGLVFDPNISSKTRRQSRGGTCARAANIRFTKTHTHHQQTLYYIVPTNLINFISFWSIVEDSQYKACKKKFSKTWIS